jgi:ADP-heptose:LPS heptosyltransferase
MIYSMGEVIGDGVIKLPFVAAIREAYPNAKITWCAGKGSTVYAGPLKPAVEGLIDEVLTTRPTGAKLSDHFTLKPFGGRKFDLVIDTQGNLARGLFARRAARDFISPVGDFMLSRSKPAKGEVWPAAVPERMARLLELASGKTVTLKPVTITDPRILAAAQALLPTGPRHVGFAPGAGGPEKRWPLDRYIELAGRTEAAGFKPVFILGPMELDAATEIRAALPGALIPAIDRTDAYPDVDGPLLTIALAARLTAAVANDAGPAHMLAAGGAPMVQLPLTKAKAAKFRPATRRLRQVIAEDEGEGGMAAISVDRVWTELEALLREGGA